MKNSNIDKNKNDNNCNNNNTIIQYYNKTIIKTQKQ